jgi:hypothetical protein
MVINNAPLNSIIMPLYRMLPGNGNNISVVPRMKTNLIHKIIKNNIT